MEDRELTIDLKGKGLGVYESPSPQGRRRICFLVHGYNVSPPEAKEAFDTLVEVMRRVSVVPSLLAMSSWRVNWRGYSHSWRDTLTRGRLSFLGYSNQISVAKRSARALADHIAKMHGPEGTPVEIFFVAHSLGCRLVLEALNLLGQSGPPVRLLFLMAAAVPGHMVYPRGSLRDAARLATSSYVLFSRQDPILEGGFRLGEFLGGERGFPPMAVGFSGEPEQGLWARRILTENDHSSYFRDANTALELTRAIGHFKQRPFTRRNLTVVRRLLNRAPPTRELGKKYPRTKRVIG